MERTVYLALGAREGDPFAQMARCLVDLERSGIRIQDVSSLWETEPVGIPPGPPVLNAALRARTALEPHDLLRACIAAEDAAGRRRTAPEWRSLDVDILHVEGVLLEEPDLVLPHPRFHRRRFNLAPLAEIAPDLVHPIEKRSVRHLLEACDDPSWARKSAGPAWAGLVERGRAIR